MLHFGAQQLHAAKINRHRAGADANRKKHGGIDRNPATSVL